MISIDSTHLNGLVVLQPRVYEDARGWFMEAFRAEHFRELGLPHEFVQENHSRSARGVVRGLHFQWDPPMGKLVRVTLGTALVVAVDIRKGSPTLGQWHTCECSAENKLQVWAPPGFARGFCAVSDVVELQYKCTGTYSPGHESGILWNDPEIGIEWPVEQPVLSPKDAEAQTLAQWLARPESEQFRY